MGGFGEFSCAQIEGFAIGSTIDALCGDAQALTAACTCSNGGGGGDNDPCYLCGMEGVSFTNPDTTTNAPGFETTCGELETLALGGSLNANTCSLSTEAVVGICSCPDEDDTDGDGMDGDDMGASVAPAQAGASI